MRRRIRRDDAKRDALGCAAWFKCEAIIAARVELGGCSVFARSVV